VNETKKKDFNDSIHNRQDVQMSICKFANELIVHLVSISKYGTRKRDITMFVVAILK